MATTEVYVLDASLNRIDLIEGVNSLVWTERYSDAGDFVLKVPSRKFPYPSLRTGNYLELPSSPHLMMIESVHRDSSTGETDSAGEDLIEVKGRSLEAILEERVVLPTGDAEHWTLTGSVGWIATELVRRICIDATEVTTNDRIPNLTYLEQDASTVSRTVEIPPQDLYKSVKELCDEDELGFRIYFDRDTKGFVFRVYRGINRSVNQSDNSRIIFSEDFDNLANGQSISSVIGYKNVAYVTSGSLVRRVQIGSGIFTGMRRRVMWVDASDIENPTNAKLDNRGRLELSKQKYTNLFDGEAADSRTFKYGIDYRVGDVVTLRSPDGQNRNSRVVEFVTTYDNDGIRRFPTFKSLED